MQDQECTDAATRSPRRATHESFGSAKTSLFLQPDLPSIQASLLLKIKSVHRNFIITMTPSRPSYICARCTLTALRNQTPRTTRSSFSTTTSASRESNVEESSPEEEVPRWARTPRAMQMPIRLRPQPNQPVWRVNDKPEVLDEVYDQILGKLSSTRGSEMLDSETKVRKTSIRLQDLHISCKTDKRHWFSGSP